MLLAGNAEEFNKCVAKHTADILGEEVLDGLSSSAWYEYVARVQYAWGQPLDQHGTRNAARKLGFIR